MPISAHALSLCLAMTSLLHGLSASCAPAPSLDGPIAVFSGYVQASEASGYSTVIAVGLTEGSAFPVASENGDGNFAARAGGSIDSGGIISTIVGGGSYMGISSMVAGDHLVAAYNTQISYAGGMASGGYAWSKAQRLAEWSGTWTHDGSQLVLVAEGGDVTGIGSALPALPEGKRTCVGPIRAGTFLYVVCSGGLDGDAEHPRQQAVAIATYDSPVSTPQTTLFWLPPEFELTGFGVGVSPNRLYVAATFWPSEQVQYVPPEGVNAIVGIVSANAPESLRYIGVTGSIFSVSGIATLDPDSIHLEISLVGKESPNWGLFKYSFASGELAAYGCSGRATVPATAASLSMFP